MQWLDFVIIKQGGRTFLSLLITHWNSLVTCYSSENHLLLVAKYACYLLQKLLIARNHSLLVAKSTHYLLQKLLIAKINLLLIAEFALYLLQKLFGAKNHLLLVAEIACCKILLVTHCRSCSLQKIISCCSSCSLQKITRYSLQNLIATYCIKSLKRVTFS